DHSGMRLDTFLANYLLGSVQCPPSTDGGEDAGFRERWPQAGTMERTASPSRSSIQRLIAKGLVTVNGRRTKASVRLKLSDRIEVQWLPPVDTALEPEAIPLHVLYEDEDLVVVNKPPGMVVHPAAGNFRGTLVNAILYHCPNLQGIGGERRPGIVHRLDKDTSGAMVVAKNERSFNDLALQFKERRISKEYVALVWGRMDRPSGMINRPIGRHRRDRKRMSSIHSLPRPREAVTEWEVASSFCVARRQGPLSWVTLIRLRPFTGRTHQIRVHLADQGYPVVGDRVYGGKRQGIAKKEDLGVPGLVDFPRQALHAERIRLAHPRTGIALECKAPWFPDMRGLLDTLKEQCVKTQGKIAKGLTRGSFFS
ncbi:MAG: RluA family pseudouridine synthase, partial [Candidatus Binatia bacterium]